eukprot:8306472-Lingulodinium_polyedra.AAC.1
MEVVTDCQGVCTSWQAVAQHLGPGDPWGGIWRQVTYDAVAPSGERRPAVAAMRWMRAHQQAPGPEVPEQERRDHAGNEHADRLAKEAASLN